jgi:hypothetical protein
MIDHPQRDISMHIDRLVLDGIDLPAEQHSAFQAALVAELTRLLAEGGLDHSLAAGGAFYRAPAAEIRLAGPAGPAVMGRQVAQSVYGGIGE